MDFDFDTIITTNYDNLIEQAFQNRNQVIQLICQDSDLAYAQPRKGSPFFYTQLEFSLRNCSSLHIKLYSS
ncbi:SIR2 family protein, partial [Lactobacillus delbrueckii subsp. bulgaricus]